MQNALGDLNGYVQENMTGFSVLKVYGREKQTLDGFKKSITNCAITASVRPSSRD